MQNTRPSLSDSNPQFVHGGSVQLRGDGERPGISEQLDYTFLDVLSSAWERKQVILGVLIASIAGAILYLFVASRTYSAQTVLMPNDSAANLMSSSGPSGGGGASFPISQLLGGSKTSSFQKEALVIFKSRRFLTSFIEAQKIASVLVPRSEGVAPGQHLLSAYMVLAKHVKINEDADTSTLQVIVKWADPKLAADWANSLVAYLNDFLRRRALQEAERQYSYLLTRTSEPGLPVEVRNVASNLALEKLRIITLANVEPEFAFKVIDTALPPSVPSWPRAAILLPIALILGALLGFFAALAVNAIHNLRRNYDRAGKSPAPMAE